MTLPRLLDRMDDAVRLLSARPAALFLDIDGTLADIAPRPGDAAVPPAVSAGLAALAERLTVAVLTGRSVADARRMVGVEAAVYAGNHGAEWWEAGRAAAAPEVAPYLPALRALAEEAARRFPEGGGFIVEDKGASLSLHFRLAADPERARAEALAFARDAGASSGLRAFEGKMVVEVRAPVEVSKGTALARVAAERGIKAAAALGDDTTDIAMFAALRGLREQGALEGFAAAVLGEHTPPALLEAADYVLDGPAEARRFIRWVAEG
ncbi:MAG: trehalose-phosphatase [Chloroflexota bacterium]|nr:trehalose-phosphatase [Chloroflexota bacterium]